MKTGQFALIILFLLTGCATFGRKANLLSNPKHPLRPVGELLKDKKFEEAEKLATKKTRLWQRQITVKEKIQDINGADLVWGIGREKRLWNEYSETFNQVKSFQEGTGPPVTPEGGALSWMFLKMCDHWSSNQSSEAIEAFLAEYSPFQICINRENLVERLRIAHQEILKEGYEKQQAKKQSRPCKIASVVKTLCMVHEEVQYRQKIIEREKEIGNVSGFVNADAMHEAGSTIIWARKKKSELASSYKKMTGGDFDYTLCNRSYDELSKEEKKACEL